MIQINYELFFITILLSIMVRYIFYNKDKNVIIYNN
jgi:hypothetical protein